MNLASAVSAVARSSSPAPIRRPAHLALAVVVIAGALVLGFAPGSASAAKTLVKTIGKVRTGPSELIEGQGGEQFATPRGVAVNESGAGGVPAGTFYVVDGENSRIQQFGPDARFVRTWGWGVKDGDAEFETCSVAADCLGGIAGASAGQLNEPMGIAVDQATGIVYVTDQGNRRLDAFSAGGAIEGAFGWGVADGGEALQFCNVGSGCREAASPGGAAGQLGERLGFPAVDSSGNVYVADRSNARVAVFTPTLAAGAITGVSFLHAFGWDVAESGDPGDTLAGEFEVCSTLCKAGSEGSGLGQFGFLGPAEVAVAPSGEVYTLESAFDNNRIQKFSAAPAPLEAEFGAASLAGVFGSQQLLSIAVDGSNGNVLVSGSREAESDYLAVAELDPSGGLLATHGSDLTFVAETFPVTNGGLAVTPASLGGNVYASVSQSERGVAVFVLNEAPTVEPVTVHSGTTATFEGEIVSNGFQLEYHFEYSNDDKTWTSLPTEEIPAGTVPGREAVAQSVTGLTGSQLYHVRLVQNRPTAGGQATSAETTFETDAAPPAITETKAAAITDTTATLRALVDPQNQATQYHFEYGTQGPCDANPCVSTQGVAAGSGGGATPVSAQISGLEPETTYYFRLVAANDSGTTEGAGETLLTYPSQAPQTNCPNQALRTGFSALLPDCRAYELVTPEDMGGHTPSFQGLGATANGFATPTVSAAGESVLFNTRFGSLAGTAGTGGEDFYDSRRGSTGWTSTLDGPTGSEMEQPVYGGFSADHEYAFVQAETEGRGTLDGPGAVGGITYLRRADGGFEVLGRGSLVPEDKTASGELVTPGGGHIIFSSTAHLEPQTPVEQLAVYDRTADGPTHVVSLAPGNVPLTTSAQFKGASADASTILFASPSGVTINTGKKLYARVDATETLEVVAGGAGSNLINPAGVSANGDQVFYVKGNSSGVGNIFSFNTVSATTTQITSVGNAQVVNVSEDGSHVYFESPSEINGEGIVGEPNLYVWSRASSNTTFIATVDEEDLRTGFAGGGVVVGLTVWTEQLKPGSASRGPLNETSRTTPDGTTLVFESRAKLSAYENAGHVEVYRYQVGAPASTCVSCNPTGIPASGNASLATSGTNANGTVLQPQAEVPSLSDDGNTVFFEAEDGLLPRDTDGVRDVYAWHDGTVSLISSGKSAQANYIYGATPDGHDVFFFTRDSLLPRDHNAGAGSIYDARIDGGFAEPAGEPPACEGDGCQGATVSAPATAGAPASETLSGAGNVKQKRHHGHRRRHHKHRHDRHKKKRPAHGNRRAGR